MTLDHLTLTNFKNYEQVDIDLCGNVNCFVGNNGAGKTNLLDAVYYLSFCKSYFNPIDSQNIRQGADFFALHGRYGADVASCIFRSGQPKQMRWNKKNYKALSEHIGRLPLVMITPADQTLVTGGSDLRRKFVDGVLSQTDKDYLDHLLQYNRALDQRNRLLKRMWEDRLWDEAMVSIWDEQLCRHGEVLYAGRHQFVDQFAPLFNHFYHWLAPDDPSVAIEYSFDPQPLDIQLASSRQNDRYAQYTTHGPHKDDFLLTLGDNMAAKRFGSQGQQKSFVLALKLAQYKYILQSRGEKPILLLDDIFDKLDLHRVERLLSLVAGEEFGQVLLTDTQPDRLHAIFRSLPAAEHQFFHVEKGEVNHAG